MVAAAVAGRGAAARVATSSGIARDLSAWARLQRALGLFQKWPETFEGFRATVRCQADGACVTGEVVVRPAGAVSVDLPGDDLRQCVEGVLREVSDTRTPRFFKDDEGRFPIACLGDDGAGGIALRVDLGQGTARTYALDEKGRVRRVEHRSAQHRSVRTYDAFVRTAPGRLLPGRIAQLGWHVERAGDVDAVTLEEVPCRVDHVWLPRHHRVGRRRGGADSVVEIALEHHRPV
jgi:hypothetical protein